MDSNHSEPLAYSPDELIGSYLDGLREAVNFVQKQIIPPLNNQINLTPKEEAVLGSFYRTHSLASSLTRLNENKDFNAVAMIARTIFELLLDLKLLMSSDLSDDDLERYRTFAEVDRFKKAKKTVEFQKVYPELADKSVFNSEIRKEFVEAPGKSEAIEAKVESLWGKTKKGDKLNWPENWHGRSIRNIAEDFGPLYEQKYLEFYSLLSSYIHGGSAAYSGLSESALQSVYGISLEISRKMYLQSLLICSSLFNLADGIESFNQIVIFLENAPKEILYEYEQKKNKSIGNGNE